MKKFISALMALAISSTATAQVVVPVNPVGVANGHPDWPQAPVDGDKGPAVGGRAYQRYRIAPATAVLLPMQQLSSLQAAPPEASDVTGDALYGSTRITLTMNSFNARQLRSVSALASSVDVSNQLIRVWTKPIANVDPRLNAYKVRLYSAGSPSSPGANYHEFNFSGLIREGQKDKEQRWGSFMVPASQFTAVGTGATLTAITFAVVEIQANTSSPFTIAVGNVEAVAPGINKGKLIIAFDDQHPNTINYASQVMSQYGFKGVLYVSPAVDTGKTNKLSIEQIKNLHDYLGWQIASQAYSTENNVGAGGIDVISGDQRTADAAKLRNWQNGLGLSGGNHGSYFSNVGVSDMIAYPMFRQNYQSMRAYYFGEFSILETYPWADPMRIRAMGAGEFQWGNNAAIYTTYWKNYVDRAIAQKGVAILVFHDGLSGSMSNWRPAFNQLMAYADANRASLDVVTVQDLEYP